MRKAAIFLALVAFGFISCSREPYGTVTHRGSDGRPDQWVYRIDKDNELVKVESDRNFNGQVDLVQEYSHGVLIRELHDDDFDGKIESIKEFRKGRVAIVERDPRERGYIDIVEYYDDSGNLIRRETRHQ